MAKQKILIVVTGSSAPEEGAGRTCITGWFEKPVSIAELVRMITTRLPQCRGTPNPPHAIHGSRLPSVTIFLRNGQVVVHVA